MAFEIFIYLFLFKHFYSNFLDVRNLEILEIFADGLRF